MSEIHKDDLEAINAAREKLGLTEDECLVFVDRIIDETNVEKDGGIVGLVTQVASQAVKQATPGIVGQSVKMVSARVRAGGSL